MIEVTATMLPSTVINDRSLDDQIAERAMPADSRSLFIEGPVGLVGPVRQVAAPAPPALPAYVALGRFHLHFVTVSDITDRVIRASEHGVAGLQSVEDFEVLVAGNPKLERREFN